MRQRTNPAVLGAFVVGAIVLGVAALVAFSGGKLFRSTQHWVAYFDESTKGLAVGAPVMFRGVKVGSVTDIKLVVNRETQVLRVPVIFAIEADRFTDSTGGKARFESNRTNVKLGFERGLRAQLELQSFVTGQLGINIDFHPGSPLRLTEGSTDYPEFPTVPSTMGMLGRSMQDLDLAQVAQGVRKAVDGVERLVNSPESQQVAVTAVGALEATRRLAETADDRIARLGPILEKMSANLDETLSTIRTLAQHADVQTVPAVTAALDDLRLLARRLEAETVPAANELTAAARQLVARLDSETMPAAGQFFRDAGDAARRLDAETVPAANRALGATEEVARRLGNETVPAANAVLADAKQVMHRLETEMVPAATQVLRNVGPLVEEMVKTAKAARAALEQAERSLVAASETVEERSPLQFQIRTTLQEVSGAARAIRTLSDYLERHPEAVMFGKGGGSR